MMEATSSGNNAAAPRGNPSPLPGHPPLSPRGTMRVHAAGAGPYPLSPRAAVAASGLAGGGPRSRSRSLGNPPPMGCWSSPQRLGVPPLSPGSLGKVLPPPGLPDNIHVRGLPAEGPPIITEQQKVMEAAVAKERERARTMEKEEENLTADELRQVLRRERHRMARLAADLAAMRSMAVQSVAEAEVHEEGRINNLMRRLEGVQQEKGRIIVELEREEEMLTNNLQRKLDEVRREKEMLEKQQMSRSELDARMTALQEGGANEGISMSEELEDMEEED